MCSLDLILAVILRLSLGNSSSLVWLLTWKAQSVIYVQDSLVTYNPGTPSLYLLTSLNPGWNSSTKYAMGLWINKISWNNTPDGWDIIATIVQNVRYKCIWKTILSIICSNSDNSCRSLIIQVHTIISTCFAAATPSDWDGDLYPWENVNILIKISDSF